VPQPDEVQKLGVAAANENGLAEQTSRSSAASHVAKLLATPAAALFGFNKSTSISQTLILKETTFNNAAIAAVAPQAHHSQPSSFASQSLHKSLFQNSLAGAMAERGCHWYSHTFLFEG
jgi:hypothetical protein